MLLCALDISDRQLRHGLANWTHFLFCAHDISFTQQNRRRVKSGYYPYHPFLDTLIPGLYS
jgi:hypothetical protein